MKEELQIARRALREHGVPSPAAGGHSFEPILTLTHRRSAAHHRAPKKSCLSGTSVDPPATPPPGRTQAPPYKPGAKGWHARTHAISTSSMVRHVLGCATPRTA